MGRLLTDLTVRSDIVSLPAVRLQTPAPVVLQGEAAAGAWRIVELWSLQGLPFRAWLEWSAGDGAQRQAWVDAGRATRVCIFARSVTVRVANQTTTGHSVAAAIADGFTQTQNVVDEPVVLVAGTPLVIDIPPYAERVEAGVFSRTVLATTTIQLLDALGNQVQELNLSELNTAVGIPTGVMRQIRLNGGNGRARALFRLTI